MRILRNILIVSIISLCFIFNACSKQDEANNSKTFTNISKPLNQIDDENIVLLNNYVCI
ncbi:putative secreted protein [Herbinix luporum]|jgi:hypothetical protein|uniref:Putative secreted protein n=1 Tax=Herbinix luporum TaxID=1679721 RepID=A0A0K8J569_9FIRM|nr:putative secreted protein [Herbinix luporum]